MKLAMILIALLIIGCSDNIQYYEAIGDSRPTNTGKEIDTVSIPEGYELLCNLDNLYKWSSSTHTQRVGTTKQEAINMAWEDFNQSIYHKCEENQ